jgi:hypothetical protein
MGPILRLSRAKGSFVFRKKEEVLSEFSLLLHRVHYEYFYAYSVFSPLLTSPRSSRFRSAFVLVFFSKLLSSFFRFFNI